MEDRSLDSNFPAFREIESNESIATITVQPYPTYDLPGLRRPIPISTIDWQSTDELQIIAGQGIDLLRGADQLHIQQTVELDDLMSNVDSENRYIVKVPNGETLFYASETSSRNQRMLCRSNRSFSMHFYDQTRQEALHLERQMACGGCSFLCCTQVLRVYLPQEHYIGEIKKEFSLSVPSFTVYNNHGSIIYRIDGPPSTGCFSSSKEGHFKVYTGDGLTQIGSINHLWDQIHNGYNLSIVFPRRRDDPRHKALLLGAAFLLVFIIYGFIVLNPLILFHYVLGICILRIYKIRRTLRNKLY